MAAVSRTCQHLPWRVDETCWVAPPSVGLPQDYSRHMGLMWGQHAQPQVSRKGKRRLVERMTNRRAGAREARHRRSVQRRQGSPRIRATLRAHVGSMGGVLVVVGRPMNETCRVAPPSVGLPRDDSMHMGLMWGQHAQPQVSRKGKRRLVKRMTNRRAGTREARHRRSVRRRQGSPRVRATLRAHVGSMGGVLVVVGRPNKLGTTLQL